MRAEVDLRTFSHQAIRKLRNCPSDVRIALETRNDKAFHRAMRPAGFAPIPSELGILRRRTRPQRAKFKSS